MLPNKPPSIRRQQCEALRMSPGTKPDDESVHHEGFQDMERIQTALPEETTQPVLSREDMNGWDLGREVYVSSILNKCKEYRNIHEGCCVYYERKYNRFTLMLIFVSSFVTVFSILMTTIPSFSGMVFTALAAILNVLVTTLTTVNKFLKFQEFATRHRMASQKFLELHRDVAEQFLSPPYERINAKKYIAFAGKTFDQIIKSAPYPEQQVLKMLNIASNPDADVNIPLGAMKDKQKPSVAAVLNPGTGIDDAAVATAVAIDPNPESLNPYQKYQLGRAKVDLGNFAGDYDV